MSISKLSVGNDMSVKILAVGQTLMQVIESRALLCLLEIDLSAQFNHNNQCRYLIDIFCNDGFCSFYSEVIGFESNAAVASDCTFLNVAKHHIISGSK